MIFRLQVFQFQRLPFRDRDTGEMKRGEGGGQVCIIAVGIRIVCSVWIYIQFPFRRLMPVSVIIPYFGIRAFPRQVFRYDLDK